MATQLKQPVIRPKPLSPQAAARRFVAAAKHAYRLALAEIARRS